MKNILPSEVQPGEIIYANLNFVNSKNKKIVIKEQVVAREYNSELKVRYEKTTDAKLFSKNEIKEDYLILKSLDLLVSLGFKNKKFDFVSVYTE